MPMVVAMMLVGACATPPPPRPTANVVVPATTEPAGDDATFRVLVRGELAEVQQADQLYERAGSTTFFVRMRVHNRTATPLGIDLRNYDLVLYPNQWGGLPSPARLTIDERRVVPAALDATRLAALRADFAATPSLLVRIPAGGDVDYYREFNASGRAEVDAVTEPWLFISMAGQLLVTDGTQGENLGLDPPATGAPGDAGMFATPIRWRVVPTGAQVVTR